MLCWISIGCKNPKHRPQWPFRSLVIAPALQAGQGEFDPHRGYHMRNYYLSVGQLRQLLEGLADNTPVLIPSSDHSYRRCEGEIGEAGYVDGDYYEWFGPEHASDGEEPVEALIVR